MYIATDLINDLMVCFLKVIYCCDCDLHIFYSSRLLIRTRDKKCNCTTTLSIDNNYLYTVTSKNSLNATQSNCSAIKLIVNNQLLITLTTYD